MTDVDAAIGTLSRADRVAVVAEVDHALRVAAELAVWMVLAVPAPAPALRVWVT